jgi:TolA-binding protein
MRRAVAVVLAASLLAAAARPAVALSTAEIRARARAVGGAGGDAAVEQQRVAALGELVLAFIDQCDNAVRAGSETARREELRGAFEAIDGPLDAIYTARAGRLEALARGVMDQDGDLEALYETPEFKQSQAVAAAALYYRNWLDYYGARLYDGARRKELLTAAEKGFSEFAVGDQPGELQIEALLGRGLCHLELGDTASALRDFQLVLDATNASPERKAKARLAMLDAYARAGRTQDALRFADEILRGGQVPAADVPVVRYVRLQTLFDAADKAKGADAERYRREAATLMDSLRASGKGWADKVDALMVARVDDPRAWAGKADTPRVQWELARLMLVKNDYAGATPLLQQLIASSDADAKGFQPEAHYWLGVGAFKNNDFATAAGELDTALAAGGGEWAGEARYLRFKALESLMAQPQADPALADRYRAALRDFLDRNPDHALAYEARYRSGELLQSQGDFTTAIEEYGKVQGDPAYVLRARFGILQSRFELLKGDADPPARTARLAAIGADLDAVDAQTKALKAQKNAGAALPEIEAKTTLLRAVYVSLTSDKGDEQVAVLLADFDQRFPDQAELQAQAVRLRLGALLQLGRFAEAEQAVARYGPTLAAEHRTEQLEGLASGFRKASARRKADGDAAGSAAAARTALALLALIGEQGGAKKQMETAQLQEATGDLAAAEAGYAAILVADPNALLALRGLARVAETRGDLKTAQARWAEYTKKSRPGDPGWFQGEYQQARLLVASGDEEAACRRLTDLRPSMPGLTDADLRRDFGTVYEQACR